MKLKRNSFALSLVLGTCLVRAATTGNQDPMPEGFAPPVEAQPTLTQGESDNLIPADFANLVSSFDSQVKPVQERASNQVAPAPEKPAQGRRETDAKRLRMKNAPPPLKVTGAEIAGLLQKAQAIKTSLQQKLFDPKLDKDAKIAALTAYVGKVFLPLRDLVTLLWSPEDAAKFAHDPLTGLLPDFPSDLAPEGSPERQFLQAYVGVDLQPVPACFDQSKLDLNPFFSLSHDIKAIGQAVTAERYVRGLKLQTLSMILAQLQFHVNNMGQDQTIEIPQGCQERFGGSLPKKMTFHAPPEADRLKQLDAIAMNSGLIAGSKSFEDYFMNSVDVDPKKNQSIPFNGLLPFQRYRVAQRGLAALQNRANPEPAMDDVQEYEIAVKMAHDRLYSEFEAKKQPLPGVDIFEKITALDDTGIDLGDGKAPFDTTNYTKGLVDRMRAKKTKDWTQVIPPELQKRFEGTRVEIELPPLDGPDMYVRWALHQLSLAYGGDPLPPSNKPAALASKTDADSLAIKRLVAPFHDNPIFLPRTALDSDELRKLWPKLRRDFWALRMNGNIPSARMSEWEFLKAQMGNNPWASARVETLLQVYDRPTSPYNTGAGPKQWIANSLDLIEPLNINHTNRAMTEDEKKRYWSMVISETDESNNHLLSTKHIASEETYYDSLEKLQRLNLFSKEDMQKARTQFTASGPRTMREINAAMDDRRIRLGELIAQIYKNQGNLGKQKEIMATITDEFPDLDDFNSKQEFLKLDTLLKRPLIHAQLRSASISRYVDLTNTLRDLCNTEPTDNDKFKELFYKTMTQQDELNKAIGIQGLPESVKAELDRWSKSDKSQLKLAGLQLAFFAGAGVITALCAAGTIATVGAGAVICAPVIAGLLTAGATGTQLYATKISLDDYVDSKRRAQVVQAYADLGFSTSEGVSKFRNNNYGYLETAANAVFVLPFIGPTAKGVEASMRTAHGAAIASREVDVKLAQVFLGMETTSGKAAAAEGGRFARILTATGEKINQRFFAPVVVDATRTQVDEAFVKTLSEGFNNDPARLRNFLGNMVGRKKVKDAKALDELLSLLDKHISEGGKLEDFARAHVDKISEVSNILPMRKRDFVYMGVLQGAPDKLEEFLAPNFLREGTFFRQANQSRDMLLYEMAKKQAQETLKLGPEVQKVDSLHAFLAFKESVADPATVESLEKEIAARVAKANENTMPIFEEINGSYKPLQRVPQREAVDAFRKVLFSPASPAEKAFAETLWKKTPAEQIFGYQVVKDSAMKSVEKLQNYDNLGQFDEFLSALKVLTLSQKPTPAM